MGELLSSMVKKKKEKETLLVLRATALQLGTSFPYKAIETKNNK